MNKTIPLLVLAMTTVFSQGQAFARDREQDALNRVENATTLVENLAGRGADAIVPKELLTKANCVVTIPGYKKAGFVFGGAYGAGLATCRNDQGNFDAPFFIALAGGSWGLQIGYQSADLLLLMMGKTAQNDLMSGAGVKLGASGSLAAGPIGRDVSAQTNLSFTEGTLSYSTTRGIFAGVSLNGAKLWKDDKANAAIEDSEEVSKAVGTFVEQLNAL